jgi:hypothetical protein
MRNSVVLKCLAGVGVALLSTAIAASGSVSAKGIESARIDGPGLDQPIEVGASRVSSVIALADGMAMWAVTPGYPEPTALLERMPASRLGPSYTVTWRVLTGVDDTTELIQELYPYAEPVPLVYTAAGQQIFDGASAGGWYRAPVGVRDALVELGVPSLTELATTGDGDRCER